MFADDAFGINKFRRVEMVSFYSEFNDPESPWRNASLLGRCTALKQLSTSLKYMKGLKGLLGHAPSLLNLTHLHLGAYKAEHNLLAEDVSFPLPRLNSLTLQGHPPAWLYNSFLRDAPQLESVNLHLYDFRYEEPDRGQFDDIPDDFLRKVDTFGVMPSDFIFELLAKSSFRPRAIDLVSNRCVKCFSDEDWMEMWSGFVKLDSLEELVGGIVPTRMFQHGMPKNLKKLEFKGFKLSLLPMEEVWRMANVLLQHPAEIELGLRNGRYGPCEFTGDRDDEEEFWHYSGLCGDDF